MLKAAIKQSPADQIRHRVISADAISAMAAKVEGLKDEIQQVLLEEKEEKAIRTAEMQLRKGQNMMEHESEIFSRPARTWFQTEKEKQAAKQASKPAPPEAKAAPKIKRDKYDGLSRKMKRRKMANEEDEKDNRAAAAIRAAKKTARPVKITQALPQTAGRKGGKSKSGKSKKGSAFEQDRGARGGAREGMRAKPVKVNLSKKK